MVGKLSHKRIKKIIRKNITPLGVTLGFLLLGLIIGGRVIQQRVQTGSSAVGNYRAANNKSYFLETWPGPGIFMAMGDFQVYALLKGSNNRVVTNQSDITYFWSVDTFGGDPLVAVSPFSACTNGIKPPCPNDHATISIGTTGSMSATNVRVKAVESSSQITLAEAEFNVTLVSPGDIVTFSDIYPNGGETFKVGVPVTIGWTLNGTPVDYCNIYYQYYENGQLKAGSVGTSTTSSFNWVIPKELKGKQVRVALDPRRNGYEVGRGISANYFQVR